ncbi:hypothetical protein A0H81_09815 [Grifola frondosa]|uniref:Uncharacterized protein n=1 Tax=Grifola frondosa TaxID=5627 RepID=A0A1C7M114_GRIFR|nr:hypothetical protein A0H81_09815 [Grifola frondosa]
MQYIPPDWEAVVSSDEDSSIFFTHRECKCVLLASEGEPGDPDLVIDQNSIRYWWIVERFPMHLYRLPRDAVKLFLSALAHATTEAVLEQQETVFPFKLMQIERLVQLYRDLKRATETDLEAIPVLIRHTANTLYTIEGARVRVSHCSRWDWRRKYTKRERSWISAAAEWLLTVIFVGVHKMYDARLVRIRDNRGVRVFEFRKFINNCLAEWGDTNLLAVVFTVANIAFQQIPGINKLQTTASLVSSVFAVLSVASGVHHIWQHRPKRNVDVIDAIKYMNHTRTWASEETQTEVDGDLIVLSCFLAIPIVSLFWSLIAFLVALLALCMQSTEPWAKPVLGSIFGAVIVSSLSTMLFFGLIWGKQHGQLVSSKLPVDQSAVANMNWADKVAKVWISLEMLSYLGFRHFLPKSGEEMSQT